MAREPYSAAPTTEPTGPSGANLQINSSPAQFGALPAQGLEKFSAGLEQGGAHLFQAGMATQALTNEADARAASNAYMKDAGTAWAQYGVLSGKQAADAYPQFAQKLQDLQQQHANSLASPIARNDFMNASSYMQNRLTLMGSTHAAQQEREYWKQSHAANVETAGQWGVLMQNDPHSVDTAAASIADSVHQLGKMNGQDDATIAAQTQQQLGKYYRQVIESQAAQDPGAALSTFDRVKSKMDGASIAETDRSLRVLHDRMAVDSFSQHQGSLTGPDVQPAQQGLTPTKIMNGLIGTEGSGPNAVSPSGATGRAQIMRGTFDQYALPGESYANEDDRRAAAKRYVDDMWKKYPGDAGRMAVGYFSGTGNIAPPGSPTPWIQNRSDGISTTEQYVNRFANIVHAPQAYTMEADRMAQIRDAATKQFPGRPDLQRQAVGQAWQEISQTNALQSKYEAEQQKYQRDQQDAAGDEVVRSLMGGRADPQQLIDTIRNNGYLTYQQKDQLWKLVQAQAGETNSHDVKTYGSGFSDLFNAVHASQDDPNRITNESQLYGHVGPNGDLTMAGLNELRKEMQGKKTPEDAAAGKMKTAAMAYAKRQIYGDDAMMNEKLVDPGKQDLYETGFVPTFLKAYDDGIKAGKSPFQLLSKDSPDYITDKVLGAIKPDPNSHEDMRNLLSDESQKPAAAKQGYDLKTQDGIYAAYKAGQIPRDQAAKLLVYGGFARAAPTAPPTVALPGDSAR